MAATFRVFSQTVDEATHVGAGLEIFEYCTYTLQRVNPPLPRIVMAAAPWLGGMRVNLRAGGLLEVLHSVLYDHGDYQHNLALMRIGNLFFFALAAIALWMWTRRELDETAALLALLLFTMQPIILGYSALATHDAAATAGVAVALLAFASWLRKPAIVRAAIVGVAYGFSVLCKFSCIPFVPLACLAIFMFRWRVVRARVITLVVVPFVAALVIWAGYAFTIEPFTSGVAEILRLDRAGHPCYFFGQQSDHGWLLYFPAAIALKTTLPFLALVLVAVFFGGRKAIEALLAAALILAISLPTKLDLGIRYVLPVYVPLCFAAGAGAAAMVRKSRIVATIALALIALDCGISVAAHPDYFPYFNVFASPDPSRYLIDSNLDWGQDVLRLRKAVRDRHIDAFGAVLLGPADLDALHFPRHYPVNAWAPPPHGWAAISDHAYRMMRTEGGWLWMDEHPYMRVGKSIRLLHLP